ncbi:MAG: VWA domain-containing protein [Armatimonadetes bacterium]|nr:VWA domain-containing protein [Armatimonadota bacterium]
MSLLSPLSLLLFAPLGGAIVVLYLLKLKRKERIVSSTMLWQNAAQDIQANAPFQKLRKNLLLFLQLLVLITLLVAAARPFVRTAGVEEHRIVVILDSSASMQSTDISPSRFEAAKSKALEVVTQLGHRDRMLIITADAKTRVVASFTSDQKALRAAIAKLRPADTTCNIRQAVTLALSLAAGKSKTPPRIVILSDGGFGALSDLPVGEARLDFIRIGRRCDNVAITGLDSRKTPSGSREVFIGVRSFSNRERRYNLEIYLGSRLIDAREETIGPNEVKQEILDPDLFTSISRLRQTSSPKQLLMHNPGESLGNVGGRIMAKLDLEDDLAVDNTGWVYLSKPRRVNVLLVSKGNIFLQNALNLDPRTQVVRAESVPADYENRGYDLIIFDCKDPPDRLPPGGYLFINTASAGGPAEIGSKPVPQSVIESDQRHPVTAYVDLGTVQIAKAAGLRPKPWATTIIEGDGGPLGAAGVNKGRRFVQISFNLLESDFPLRVGFPIFVTNCLDWLVPEDTESGESIRTGSPAYIDVPPGIANLTVTNPDGRSKTIDVNQTPVIYDDTAQTGVYTVSGQGFRKEFACNLARSEESATAPKDVVVLGGRKFSGTSRSARTNRELYGFLIAVAVCVLVFEWYAYHRRL